jgi:hypothetical protein
MSDLTPEIDEYPPEDEDDPPRIDLPTPSDLAEYFTDVFRDEEASSFERMQAAVGLQSFWVGMELNKINETMGNFSFIPVPVDPVPGPTLH